MYMCTYKLRESGLTKFNNQTQIVYFNHYCLVSGHEILLWASLIKLIYQWFWWQCEKEVYEL
jgi:hypothetical protein